MWHKYKQAWKQAREREWVQASGTMGKGGNWLQNDNQNIKELQEAVEKLENQVVKL